MSQRHFVVEGCPVPVEADTDESGFVMYVPCGQPVQAECWVHEDGAEYGVYVDLACGHDFKSMATAIQYEMMGVDIS